MIMTVSTGMDKLDEILGGGLHEGSVLVIGARPSMGKTSLMLSMCTYFAKEGIKFLYVTFESKPKAILKNLIYKMADLPLGIIEKGNYSAQEFQKFIAFQNETLKSDIIITDKEDFENDLAEIETPPRVILVDFVQMITKNSPCEDITRFMIQMKSLAKKLNATVIVASQLSRAVENRPGHIPMLTDLRDSGSLEEISDQVIFIRRRDYYDPYDKPGLAELFIEKNRFGDRGIVQCVFRKEMMEFINYSPLIYQAEQKDEEAFSQFSP